MLIPPDKISPTATLSPSDEATNVAIFSDITLTFSEAVQRGIGSIYLKLIDGTVIAIYDAATSRNLSISGITLTINPTDDLSYSTGYKLEFAAGAITDLAGNSYPGTSSYNFTTAAPPDTTPPTATFTPADESADIGIASNFVVTFSEAVQRGTGSIVLKTADGTVVATYDAATSSNLSISGATLTINPAVDLDYSSGYKLEFAASAINDLAGNSYAGTSSYNFTTAAAPAAQYDINASAVFWKGAFSSAPPVPLAGVTLTEGGKNGTSDPSSGLIALTGALDVDGADDGNLTLVPHLDAPSNAKSAITLTDVLATLKVYLGKPLPEAYASPLNYAAADFDDSGAVTLTDVLQLLKYYLNKPTSATPKWQFVDAADMSADGKTFLGANGANLAKDNTTPHAIDQIFDATHTSIELVGFLRGDLDGSWTA